MIKRDRDELLMSVFKKDELIKVNGLDLQRELQNKDEMERTLVMLTKRCFELEEKLQWSRSVNQSLSMLTMNEDDYKHFEVRA